MDPITLQFDPLTIVLVLVYLYRAHLQERRLGEVIHKSQTPEKLLLDAMQNVLVSAAKANTQDDENDSPDSP